MMYETDSQFDSGRMDNYLSDFHRIGNYRDDSHDKHWSISSKKFDYTDSIETTESSEGFVFRIPLTEISLKNLKIIPTKRYIIVQSNLKTIFINIDHSVDISTLTSIIDGSMLIIGIEKN